MNDIRKILTAMEGLWRECEENEVTSEKKVSLLVLNDELRSKLAEL